MKIRFAIAFIFLTTSVDSQNIGIGTTTPRAPLSFSSLFGKKISLYPGASGDAGLGTATNQFQIFADNINSEVAIGYDANGVFTKRFGFKANGRLEFNGTIGLPGQVLASYGNNSYAAWTGLGSILKTQESGNTSGLHLISTLLYNLNSSSITITTVTNAHVMVYYKTKTWKDCFFGDCNSKWLLKVLLDGVVVKTYGIDGSRNSSQNPPDVYSDLTIGPDVLILLAGTHTISFQASNCYNEPYIGFSAMAVIIPND